MQVGKAQNSNTLIAYNSLSEINTAWKSMNLPAEKTSILYANFNQVEDEDLVFKYKEVNRPKRWGIALTTLGIALTATGAVMIANSDALYYSASTSGGTSGDPLGGFGIITLGHGIGGIVVGAILWKKGNKRKPKLPTYDNPM